MSFLSLFVAKYLDLELNQQIHYQSLAVWSFRCVDVWQWLALRLAFIRYSRSYFTRFVTKESGCITPIVNLTAFQSPSLAERGGIRG